jgi:hypothetical protein
MKWSLVAAAGALLVSSTLSAQIMLFEDGFEGNCAYSRTDVTSVPYSTVFAGQVFTAASDLVQFTSPLCPDDPDSAEVVYGLDIDTSTEIYVQTDCDWDCEVVITSGGCENADIVQCAASFGNETILTTLTPGFHYLFVEGDNPGDPASFDIMINRHNINGQTHCVVDAEVDVENLANCVDPVIGQPYFLTELPSESLSPADIDDSFAQDIFSCTADIEHVGGAPDRVYQFDISGVVAKDVEIELVPDGWDSILYLTAEPCGAQSATLDCQDSLLPPGETISQSLDPGTYYIVVDGFGEAVFSGLAWGDFSLTIKVYDPICNE